MPGFFRLLLCVLGGCAVVIAVMVCGAAAKGQCPACGYDLTGNVSGVCPECGENRT